MEIVLTNTAGLFALLGIPAVIIIHFLQQQAREVPITTRFLLEQMRKESIEGRKLERLRSSIPLWLQILIVLLVTWILVAPRWKRTDSVQRTAVVLDSSASMQAFKGDLTGELTPLLRDLASRANQAEFVILDSQLGNESLYHGSNLDELLAVIEAWTPLHGAHDPGPALQVAHSLVGREGTIILATDHVVDNIAFDGKLLAVGSPIANCGFTGLRVSSEEGEPRWRVMARNYSDEAQTRSWRLEAGGKSSPPQTVTLEPRQTMVLQGAFPPGAEACTIHLDPDAFPLDDRIPFVRAAPKTLYFRKAGNPAYDGLFESVFATLENLEPAAAGTPPDLVFATYDPLDPGFPESNAIIGITQRVQEKKLVQGAIVAETHDLMNDLNWQSLVCRSSLNIPQKDSDEVLLWQAKRPLVMLRRDEEFRQLIFNFDLTASNVDHLPAFIVMLHRFVGSIREAKVALETINAETGQPLRLAADRGPGAAEIVMKFVEPGGTELLTFAPDQAAIIRAPQFPGFFQISQGETHLVHGATYFADTREADFKNAVSANHVDEVSSVLVERHTRDDPFWRIWVVFLGGVLLANWHFTGSRARIGNR